MNYKISLPDDPDIAITVQGTGPIDALNRFMDLINNKDKSELRIVTIIRDKVTINDQNFILTRVE